MIHRAFRYRLQPTAEQAARMEQWCGVTRLVYNLALEQRTTWRGRSFAAQEREATELRAEYDFVADLPRYAVTSALRDLDRAMTAFFKGQSRYPQYRRKFLNESFRLQGRDVHVVPCNRRWAFVRLPKLGLVKFRCTRPIVGEMQNMTVSHSGGAWFVSVACAIERDVPANPNPAVGIDRGIANTLMLSTGEAISIPATLFYLDGRKRRAQKMLTRRKRGSARYAKMRRRVSRIAARAARIRADWHHRTSLDIAKRFRHVALEDLRIQNMTRRGRGKRGLNRSILEQGWGAFATKLAYKLEERGGALILVDPRHTSQTCSACGAVDSRSRESQASFVCTECGSTLHADHNAAINILRRSTSAMSVEGREYAPAEAETCLMAA